MRTPDFVEFAEHCQDQAVTLHPVLARSDSVRFRPHHDYTPPGHLLRAIMVSGGLLREDPDTDLADKPIELSERLAADTAARALAGIVNGSLEPLGPEEGVTDFSGTGDGTDVCDSAEAYFVRNVQGLEKNDGSRQIIGDSESLLLRKLNIGLPTALSLRTVGVNGIPYPPGSLFQIAVAGDGDKEERTGTEVLGTASVVDLNFMRLSAFALSPAERENNYLDESFWDAFPPGGMTRQEELQRASIDELAEIVRTAF